MQCGRGLLCQRREDGTMRKHFSLSKWVDVTIEVMKKFWTTLINIEEEVGRIL